MYTIPNLDLRENFFFYKKFSGEGRKAMTIEMLCFPDEELLFSNSGGSLF